MAGIDADYSLASYRYRTNQTRFRVFFENCVYLQASSCFLKSYSC